MAVGTTVFRIRIELIFRRCCNLVTPSRSCSGLSAQCRRAAYPRLRTRWRRSAGRSQTADSGLTGGLPWGQYLATAANAFDHSVKRRVLAIDWIVRITRQVLLRRHLIGPRLAVADRCLRQQLLVRVRRWRWCGWISRTSRLRNRHRSVDQGQQRYRRDQLSHDGSHELGAPLTIYGRGRLDHKVPKPHVSFRWAKHAGFGPALYASPGAVRRVSFSVCPLRYIALP
jgi:hypothetical protein